MIGKDLLRLLFILIVTFTFSTSFILNGTKVDVTGNQLETSNNSKKLIIPKGVETRRKKKKERSTSSSSGEKHGESSKDGGLTLDISGSSASWSSDSKEKKDPDKAGWVKWHRKCQRCPYDMNMKYRDKRIKWICGAYQRARRTFKSMCMMHYRNCQDGTMFTKIQEGMCPDNSTIRNHGDHFFYEYHVKMPEDSSSTEGESDTASESDEYNIFNVK